MKSFGLIYRKSFLVNPGIHPQLRQQNSEFNSSKTSISNMFSTEYPSQPQIVIKISFNINGKSKTFNQFIFRKFFTKQIPNCQQIPHTKRPSTEKILNRKITIPI